MHIQKQPKTVQKFERQGEGESITMIRHPVDTKAGGSQNISFDFKSARVPERRYPAEIAGLTNTEHMVRLCFGQTKLVGTGISTLLVIHVPFIAIRRFIESLNAGLGDKAQNFFKTLETRLPSLLDLSKETEQPASVVTLEANIIAFAFHGRESCLDFYHVSAFVWDSVLNRGGQLYAEPVVRVTLSTSLALSIFDVLKEQVSSYPRDDSEEIK